MSAEWPMSAERLPKGVRELMTDLERIEAGLWQTLQAHELRAHPDSVTSPGCDRCRMALGAWSNAHSYYRLVRWFVTGADESGQCVQDVAEDAAGVQS